MAFYGCCKVEQSGQIILFHNFQSLNDIEAVTHAETLVAKAGWPIAELWEGPRRVWQATKL